MRFRTCFTTLTVFADIYQPTAWSSASCETPRAVHHSNFVEVPRAASTPVLYNYDCVDRMLFETRG